MLKYNLGKRLEKKLFISFVAYNILVTLDTMWLIWKNNSPKMSFFNKDVINVW
jgi:hypothetical protein